MTPNHLSVHENAQMEMMQTKSICVCVCDKELLMQTVLIPVENRAYSVCLLSIVKVI